jgi:hypothetical protein
MNEHIEGYIKTSTKPMNDKFVHYILVTDTNVNFDLSSKHLKNKVFENDEKVRLYGEIVKSFGSSEMIVDYIRRMI